MAWCRHCGHIDEEMMSHRMGAAAVHDEPVGGDPAAAAALAAGGDLPAEPALVSAIALPGHGRQVEAERLQRSQVIVLDAAHHHQLLMSRRC